MARLMLSRISRGRTRGMTIFETLMVMLVVSVLILTVMARYRVLEDRARRTATLMEIRNFELALRLYNIFHHRFPPTLRDVTQGRYSFPDDLVGLGKEGAPAGEAFFNRKYLETNAVDAEGYPIDSWGMRYGYDPIGGRIWSEHLASAGGSRR
jgi:type II secretory pathway pseudopilin PulG